MSLPQKNTPLDRRFLGLRLFPANLKGPLLRLSVVLLLLLAGLYLLQSRLLYHPDRYPLDELKATLAAQHASAWPSLPSYRGLLSAPTEEKSKGTILVFHGNSDSAADRTFYFQSLVSLGYRVLLLEYPGYGPRDGKLNETTLIGDGVESLRLAHKQFGEPVYVFGESLGAGVAAGVIGKAPELVAGAVLITPWDTMPHLVRARFHLPQFFVRDTYDSIANLRSFKGPVTVVLAENDEVVPRKCTLNLYRSLAGPKRLVELKGAAHNTWYGMTSAKWWEDLLTFTTSNNRP